MLPPDPPGEEAAESGGGGPGEPERSEPSAGHRAPDAGGKTDQGDAGPRLERPTPRQRELERSLGLPEALSIGVGTMIGAGIFVFPGLAAGRAGPAAMLSFAVGGGIALLVALPTSELATAMPESGGGYYFVSRSLGGLAGSVAGLGQWLGLVFASAFYLVGFGYYAADTASELGFASGVPVVGMAIGAAVLLTGVGIAGTRKSGKLQNGIVGLLLLLLSAFLGYGVLDALGIVGGPRVPETFAPFGALPIFTTAALIFTSYLGFAQIANVAGEVRAPGRNLPRAMVGSVVLVGAFYVGAIFVSTSAFGSRRLAQLGETAIVEVARSFMGPVGAVVILAAGVLATLSSANASILSSSRMVYALSRDRVLPEGASRVGRRFRTPHVALLLAGSPLVLLVLTGRVELLAEVASLLHLVMYGLICLALLRLRRDPPDWYRPSFRCPGHPWLPSAGAAASFGLVAFMSPVSMATGGLLLLTAAGWYLTYGREAEFAAPEFRRDSEQDR